MAEKIYVVTLKKREDLDGFYSDMETNGFRLNLKRPISRNTHYWMTEDQANTLKDDSRVLAVSLTLEDLPVKVETYGVDNTSQYDVAGDFWKWGPGMPTNPTTLDSQSRQWGHLHCAGNDAQRQKGSWGEGSVAEEVNDVTQVYNTGKHVDVVICDTGVCWDSADFISPSTGQSRFVQYEWFNELNGYVSSIDDDGTTLPTGSYSYHPTNGNPQYHGQHVAGTVAGQWYGWANEANIYGLEILTGASYQVPDLVLFDYLRAFHRYKPINPETGKRNPTISNHSWGISWNSGNIFGDEGLLISDISSISFRGNTYNAGSPGPSGWTQAGLNQDFGILFGQDSNGNAIGIPYYDAALSADIEDCIEDGVVLIGAAGNANYYMAPQIDPATGTTHVDWNNKLAFQTFGTDIYYHRGASPSNAKGVICVGALDTNADFRRADFTNYGPRIDIFAPGVDILSCFTDTLAASRPWTVDQKYPNGQGYFYPLSGTSMAAPQVCGILALAATAKERFNATDALAYLQREVKLNDMTFDVGSGTFADITCQCDSPNSYILTSNPREETGYIAGWYTQTLKGHRRNEELNTGANIQLFPRTNSFFRKPAYPAQKNFTSAVSHAGGEYVMTGEHRGVAYNAANDPTIELIVGDTITFNLNASGHPFWISNRQGTNTPVTAEIPSGVTNNGDDVGTITWDTTGVEAGTWWYNCEYHSSMQGQIILTLP